MTSQVIADLRAVRELLEVPEDYSPTRCEFMCGYAPWCLTCALWQACQSSDCYNAARRAILSGLRNVELGPWETAPSAPTLTYSTCSTAQ